MNEFEPLIDVLEQFLGVSKNGINENGQIQFCCPECANSEGVDSDGKYNLEVNIFKNGGTYRCWKCDHENDMHGKLSKLIKKYGNNILLSDYQRAIREIKKTKQYELNIDDLDYKLEDVDQFIVKLPEKSYDFLFNGNKREIRALEYLEKRFGKYTEQLIRKHGIKYTDNFCYEPIINGKPSYILKNRIILPSYDKFNSLNFFTGRSYVETARNKYFNCLNVEKTEIQFNEKLINWDADIYIVEGPIDHIVIPNSIPLLGKSLYSKYYIYAQIIKNSTQKIIVFLDSDATKDALNICSQLSCYETCGRLFIVPTKKIMKRIKQIRNPEIEELDPGKLFELYGPKGISWALKQAEYHECR